MIIKLLFILTTILLLHPAQAKVFGPGDGKKTSDYSSSKSAMAISLQDDESVKIDGKLDEGIWDRAFFVDEFKAQSPIEGLDPTERTEVAFVYDGNALIIGARMYSEDPDKILRTVTRRDAGRNSERLIISLDTYLDRRTAYSFSISAAGVRGDYYHPSDNDGNRDFSFDPVWIANAKVDSLGWTAEMRIPFSQLRFDDKEKQIWGLNINRWIPSKNEDVFWVMIPRDENGWSSRFGNLEGIENVVPKRRIELIPYVSASSFAPGQVDSNNPFEDNINNDVFVGGDVKLGLGPNLTLDATVNPDFGQVEADPAVVNLSIFEVIFEERRPFFTEGNQLFNTRGADYFYSRRIGGAPSLRPDTDFSEQLQFTSILGASKLTGRLSNGLSVGAIFAATQAERVETLTSTTVDSAFIADNPELVDEGDLGTNFDQFGRAEVEPLSAYSVVRLQQEFGEDASTVGLILTGVQRANGNNQDLRSILTDQAYSGGTDYNIRFQGGRYEVSGDLGFSHVTGSQDVITRLQRRSSRYFQRPDADYVSVDSNATNISGYRGSFRVSKNAGRRWLWRVGASVNSPGFELNDIGILRKADRINNFNRLTYRVNEPTKNFLRYGFRLENSISWNYGGTMTDQRYEFGGNFDFYNFWATDFEMNYRPRTQSDILTRGGPLMQNAQEWGVRGSIRSNFGAPKFARLGANYSEDELGSWEAGVNMSFRVSTTGRLEYSISPRYSRESQRRQFLDIIDGTGPAETFGNRYLFANIERSTLSMQVRVNYSINPDLSLEVYAEPFASSGEFSEPGQLPEAEALRLDRFNVIGKTQDGDDIIEENGTQFEIRDPDFNRRSFRSNVVLRYEWKPGSTFFLVWQQNRSASLDNGDFVIPGDLTSTFNQRGDNVLAVKFTYWFTAN